MVSDALSTPLKKHMRLEFLDELVEIVGQSPYYTLSSLIIGITTLWDG